jgi:nitroimidazol reductase NimA-like FMN-containing flavoprotein (pyridoxamine 5'-phosphate oxidase superfamily)
MAILTETGALSPQEWNAFLAKPIIARIATVSPDRLHPHVVPVWFLWEDETLWISSYRTTKKFRDLNANPNCSIVIDEAEGGLDYWAVVMEGKVELIDHPVEEVRKTLTRIYARYLGLEGVLAPDPQEWINDPNNLLIKLHPEKIITWFSRSKVE